MAQVPSPLFVHGQCECDSHEDTEHRTHEDAWPITTHVFASSSPGRHPLFSWGMAGRPEPTYRLTIAPGLSPVKSDMLAHQTPCDSFLSQEALPVGDLLTRLLTLSQNQ